MQVQATSTAKTTTTAKTATGDGFAKALSTAQTTDATATRNARSSARTMRSIMVPKASAAVEATTRRFATAADTESAYGRGTLASIVARIRQA